MKKKILTLALALVLCISAAFMFAGCGDPGHMSTLTIDKPAVLEFEVGDVGWQSKVNDLVLVYKANGDKQPNTWNKEEQKYEEKPYEDWTGTFAEAIAACGQDGSKVRTCTYTRPDVSTVTAGETTRTFSITINNATVRIEYKVI